MNKKIKKEKINIFFIFFGILPKEICQIIVDIIFPGEVFYNINELCKEINEKVRYQNEYKNIYEGYYIKSWTNLNLSIWNNTSLKKIAEFNKLSTKSISFMKKEYNDNLIGKKTFYFDLYRPPFLLEEHGEYCGCDVCLISYDYPRDIYLYRKIKKKNRGNFSKTVNKWFLFEHYLTATKGFNKIETKFGTEDRYGFTSIYDRVNNYKKIYNQYHPLINNDKNKLIQLENIWGGLI